MGWEFAEAAFHVVLASAQTCGQSLSRKLFFAATAAALKESAEERRRFIRDADNLVRCLTIKFEVELGLGSTVVPIEKKLELSPPQDR